MKEDSATTNSATAPAVPDVVESLRRENAQLSEERDRYRHLADLLKRELERLRDGQKTPREHVESAVLQLAFGELAKEILAQTPPPGPPAPPADPPAKIRKHTPHGRSVLPEHLPVETVVLEPTGAVGGTVIDEEISWRLAFRRGGFYRLKVVRPVLVIPRALAETLDPAAVTVSVHPGDFSRLAATEPAAAVAAISQAMGAPEAVSPEELAGDARPDSGAAGAQTLLEPAARGAPPRDRDRTIVCAPAPDEMIPRGLPTADLLAKILVAKFADKLPFRRQEGMLARERVTLSAGTMCGWAEGCHALASPVVEAMHRDAVLHAHFIGSDSTGVLVQANEKCKRGHFWVLVADLDHVIFRYSKRCSSEEPKTFLKDFTGTVVADASAVFDALFGLPEGPKESGCHSHARRYFYKALLSDRERALIGIGFFNELFRVERDIKELSVADRLRIRQQRSRPIIDRFEQWRTAELAHPDVADGTPIRRALKYTANHWAALCRFLSDGKIPTHNNRSELELRRLVIGRANWLFVGSDETAPWTCTFVSLIASCQLHGLDPETYLRELFRVLPTWPAHRVLELAPKFWAATRARLSDTELAFPLGPVTIPPNFVTVPAPGQAPQ